MRPTQPILFSALIFGMSVSTIASAFSTPDFLPNCDIRQLNLSNVQKTQLRDLRSAYKTAVDKISAIEQRTQRARSAQIERLLSAPNFEEQQAVRYVLNRYQHYHQFAVEELAIQHKLYQLLDSRQRKIWLSTCVR